MLNKGDLMIPPSQPHVTICHLEGRLLPNKENMNSAS